MSKTATRTVSGKFLFAEVPEGQKTLGQDELTEKPPRLAIGPGRHDAGGCGHGQFYCHPERSEGSAFPQNAENKRILRAKNPPSDLQV